MVTHLLDLAEDQGVLEELVVAGQRRVILEGDAMHEALRLVVREELQRAGVQDGPDRLMTVKAAADFAGLKPATIREWITSGKLKALKAGPHWRIELLDLKAAMDPSPAQARIAEEQDARATANGILLDLQQQRNKKER